MREYKIQKLVKHANINGQIFENIWASCGTEPTRHMAELRLAWFEDSFPEDEFRIVEI